MKSKTIILSNENNSGRGILTISYDDDLLKCKMRLYNIQSLDANYKIGIYHKKQVYSSNLLKRNDCYESSLVGDFEIEKDFYCAIINTADKNSVLLSGGTYAGYYFNDNSVFSSVKNDTETLSDTYDFLKDSNDETCSSCDVDKCKNCKYKEFFYAQENSTIKPATSENLTNNLNVDTQDNSLINSIMPQFNYIFETYTADNELNNLIKNGKFVKIDEGINHYSLGAIFENNEMKYICYATKKDYNDQPPEEIGKNYQWLPIDQDDPLSEGYYIVYQDAKDLKILEM